MGTSWGKVSGWRGRRRGHPSVPGSGAAGRGGLAAGSAPAARAFPPNAFTSGASARHPPISQRRGNARCPKRPAAPPAEVAANRERGPSAVRGCALKRCAPPPSVGLSLAVAGRCALRPRATSDPRPAAKEREGWPSVLRMGGGEQNTRTVWLRTRGRWRGGGVERKTPGLNCGI